VNFRALPLDVQAQYLSEQAARRDMSGDEAELFKRLEASHNKIRSDIASGNGLLRAAKDGLFDQSLLAVPNIQTPDDFANFLRQRDGMAIVAQSHYGVPIDRLNPAEVSDMVEQYANTDTDGRLALFGAIVDNISDDAAKQLLSKFDQNGSTNLAIAGVVYSDGAPNVAESILRGRDTPPEIMPNKSDINLKIYDRLGTMYPMEVSKHIVDAVRATYGYQTFLAGDVSKTLDTTRLQNAINDVTGGIVDLQHSGTGIIDIDFGPIGYSSNDTYEVQVPVRGMTADDMYDLMESVTPEQLLAQGGTHPATPEDNVAQLLNEGFIKLIVGDGFGSNVRYLLQTHTGDFVMGADNDIFLLSFNTETE
jgi:hypothetical protein